MLGYTIHLDFNAVITARIFSHKSKFIYHLGIVYYQEESIFDKGLIKKL